MGIWVESYAGHRQPTAPRTVDIDGRRFVVDVVLYEARISIAGEERLVFTVRLDDGRRMELAYLRDGTWDAGVPA